mgnify:CR=1 FL=1
MIQFLSIHIFIRSGTFFVVKQKMGADPASVAYDTLSSAVANNADIVIIDTAGRLHNKVGLMNELTKIKNVMKKVVLRNTCKSSIPSPKPMYLTGILNWSEIPITTPPLAVPSSLVIAIAVTSVARVNCLACSKAFCPVEPSNTSAKTNLLIPCLEKMHEKKENRYNHFGML